MEEKKRRGEREKVGDEAKVQRGLFIPESAAL